MDKAPTQPRPNGLSHVVLRTSPQSYQAMVSWYTSFLNGTIVASGSGMSFISIEDGEHHRLAIFADESIPPNTRTSPSHAGLDHLAFSFRTLAQLADAYEANKAAGRELVWVGSHGHSTSLNYHDPDGNEVEVTVESCTTPEELQEYVAQTAFRKGVLDPDVLVRRVRSGEESEKSIMRFPAIVEA